jgi:hypothetical protein
MNSDHKNKFEAVDALQEWGRHFRDKNHPVALTLFRAAAIIVTDIQILKNFAAGGGTVGQASTKMPFAPGGNTCDHCGAELVRDCMICGAPNCCPRCCQETTREILQSQKIAAGTADEKPGGQAENQ